LWAWCNRCGLGGFAVALGASLVADWRGDWRGGTAPVVLAAAYPVGFAVGVVAAGMVWVRFVPARRRRRTEVALLEASWLLPAVPVEGRNARRSRGGGL
jgi:hypothetical protein